MLDITYEDLVENSSRTLQEIFRWLGIEAAPIEVRSHFKEDRRAKVKYPKNDLIERYNSLLNYNT